MPKCVLVIDLPFSDTKRNPIKYDANQVLSGIAFNDKNGEPVTVCKVETVVLCDMTVLRNSWHEVHAGIDCSGNMQIAGKK